MVFRYDKKRVKNFLKFINVFFVFIIIVHQFFPIFEDYRIGELERVSAAEVSVTGTVHGTLNMHKNQPSMVFTSGTVGYHFYVDSGGTFGYSKTTDGGESWNAYVATTSQADIMTFSIWYDQWTPGDTSGTTIHIFMMDSGADDVWYDTLNTSNDSNGTEAAISTAFGNSINTADQGTITKSTTGVLYVLAANGATTGQSLKCSATCTNAGNWSAAGTTPLDTTNDMLRLVPLASGNVMVIRHKLSTDIVASKVYTASSDSWAASWTAIATSIVESGTYLETISVTVNKSNNDIYLAYGASVAGAGTADIRTAIYSGGSWTLKTDVLTNQNTLTNLSIAIRDGTDDVYVAYLRGTAGSSMNAYYKESTDGMANWGSEVQLNSTVVNADLRWMYTNVLSDKIIYAVWEHNTTLDTKYGALVKEFGVITNGTTGTQTSSVNGSSSNNYIGAFTLVRNFGTSTISEIKVSENGTVNANSNLSNLDLYYETAGTCTYNGTESLFGTATSFDASDDAVVTGSLAVSSSQICLYAVLDVGSGATNGQTIEIEITNPSTDFTVNKGTISPGSTVAISGTTTISVLSISVILTTDGAVAYGIVPISTSKSTITLSDTQIAQNDGSATENFNIKTSNATGGTTWTLNSTPGTNQYVHKFSTNSGGGWTTFTTPDSYQTLATSVSVSGTVNIDLELTTPSSTSDYQQKSITVTIQAVAP